MQAVIPQKLRILNDSVPENDADAWNAETQYPAGKKVVDDHKQYRALVDTIGVRPSTQGNSDSIGATWLYLEPTNKYNCIDGRNDTQTVAPQGATELVIQVPFERPANALGLLNVRASSISVTLTRAVADGQGGEAAEPVWESGTVGLLRDSVDYWDYFFGICRQVKAKVFTAIPPVTGTLTITLNGNAPAIGNIIVGEHLIFGLTEYGVRSGFVSYSSVSTDGFGNVTRTKRGNAKRATFPVYVHPDDLDYVQDILEDLDGEPALWIGDNGVGFQSLVIYGDLREYEAGIDDYGQVSANFEIRGVV